jgi:hypothetical protein
MKYVLSWCVLFVFGGLFSQNVPYNTFGVDEYQSWRYLLDPNGNHIMFGIGEKDHLFHSLDLDGNFIEIDELPRKSQFGDTLVSYGFGQEYKDGFVVVGLKHLINNGIINYIGTFVEFYNWDFEKTNSIMGSKLNNVKALNSFAIMDSTLFFTGNPVIYSGDTARADYSQIDLYEVSLSDHSILESTPSLPSNLSPNEISLVGKDRGFFLQNPNRFSYTWQMGGIADFHIVNLNLETKNWETKIIPGDLFDYQLGNGGARTANLFFYNGEYYLGFVTQMPILNGDFNHQGMDAGQAYFYLFDDDLNVIHKLRYTQEVYNQIPFYAFIYAQFIEFSGTTFSCIAPYNNEGKIHPYTQEIIANGFFGFEFEIATGEEVNSWYVKRDDILPVNYNPSVYQQRPNGFLKNGDVWHVITEETLDFSVRNFSIVSIKKDDMHLGVIEGSNSFDFSLHPNPFESSIHVSLKGQGTFVITDLAGKFLDSGILAGNGKIDLEELPSGMYLFQLMSSDGRTAVRSIVKK